MQQSRQPVAGMESGKMTLREAIRARRRIIDLRSLLSMKTSQALLSVVLRLSPRAGLPGVMSIIAVVHEAGAGNVPAVNTGPSGKRSR